jgi:hypothetical protein
MPQHSLEYLHFLAKKRKREQEKVDKGYESSDSPMDGMLVDHEDSPPVKIPRKRLTQMIDEMWDEVMLGRTTASGLQL